MKLKFFLYFFLTSYFLNFFWEVSQMFLYSDFGMGFRGDYLGFLKIHWLVTFLDVLMIFTVYFLIVILTRNLKWPTSRFLYFWPWIIFVILLPIWQAAVEYDAVYVSHRWEYLSSMPLIFGIGLLPVLQMLILPSLSLLLNKRLLKDGN